MQRFGRLQQDATSERIDDGGTMRLSQVLGVEKGKKAREHRAKTDLYRLVQSPEVFAGLSRTYVPIDDDGEKLPPEGRRVQCRVPDILKELREVESEWFDIAAMREWGNTVAKANVVVDGETILSDVPVPYLLFLEKQLVDLHTFVTNLPTLDANEEWEFDGGEGLWRSQPVETIKYKKVPRNHVKAPATDRHPAQVEVYHEDVPVGRWTRIVRSGAAPQTRIDELVARVVALRDAVIVAREEANTYEVETREVGDKVFNYLFA